MWLCQLSALAQTDGYDPSNPPNPTVPEGQLPDTTTYYNLQVVASPVGAGNLNTSGGQYAAGTSMYLYAYNNNSCIFQYWMDDEGNTLSTSYSFYYTMPARDARVTAVYLYQPGNPGNPEGPQDPEGIYTLTLTAKPEGAGSFNFGTASMKAGEQTHLYAYTSSNFKFLQWEDAAGNLVSTAQSFYYTMPAEDTQLYGVYEYAPDNPGNPGKNAWDEFTGEVIVDDFTPGSLSSAVSEAIGGSQNASKVTMITVGGKINNYDFSIANNYSNCTLVDLSRTTGANTVPSYCYSGNSYLTQIILPASIETIEYRAFYNCTALTSLTCYAMTPPKVDGNAFTGVQDGLVVYVPEKSIELYEAADVWKDFVILPIQDNVHSLELNLPQECSDGRYKNMSLELLNIKSGQKYKYVITDRINYTFNNLIKNTLYNAYLKNQAGVILAEIDSIAITNEDVSLTFDDIKSVYNVSVGVNTPEGSDVTAQTGITWYDGEGTYLGQGRTLAAQVEGTTLRFAVSLPQTLGMLYVAPADSVYEVSAGGNDINMTLASLPRLTLSGNVKDVGTGIAINGATVTVAQTLNGKYSKAFTAKTDSKGAYSVEVFAAPSTVTFASAEYINQSVALTDSMLALKAVTLDDVQLKAITGTTVAVGFTYTPSVAAGAEAETQNWYSDYNNVAYTIYNKTQDKAVTQFSVQYPNIVLLEETAIGDVLRLTATSKTGAFKDVTVEGTVNEQDRVSVTFPIVQLGGISASFSQTENTGVVAVLYDADGMFMKKYSYTSAAISISDLADGDYTLVTMGESNFFNSIYSLNSFTEAGLKEGTDYVKNVVKVESGVIAAVKNPLVPFFDESKFYYTGDNTAFTVNKSSIVAGNYLTLQAKVDFKDVYRADVSNVELVFELPEGNSFVENSLMVGSSTSVYQFENNTVTVQLNGSYTDRVRFCVIPTAAGNYAPNAYVRFAMNGTTVTQPIGSAEYEVKSMSIYVPSQTAKTTLVVNGTATSRSKVEIYDGNTLIGQTTALANGFWNANCEFVNPYNLSVHDVYAKITSATGLEFTTDVQRCLYDKNAIEAKTVSMSFYNRWLRKNVEVVWDFQTNKPSSNSYMFYTGTDITFVADLTNNDTTVVSDVNIYVFTDKNEVRKLEARYDKRINKWVGTSFFQSNNLPINISIDFSSKTTSIIESDSLISDEAKSLGMIAELLDAIAEKTLIFELNEDTENYCSYYVKSSLVEDSLLYTIRELNFEDSRKLLAESQYDFFEMEDGQGYFCFQVKEESHSLSTIVIDLSKEMAFEITMSSTKKYPQAAPSYSTIIKALKTYWKSGELFGHIGDITDGVLDVAGIGKYLNVPNFNMWYDIYENYINTIILEQEKIEKMILAKCSDGSSKLTEDEKNSYIKRWKELNYSSDLFFGAFESYLNLYKTKLEASIYFDALFMGVGKLAGAAVKGLATAGKVVSKSKNLKYFEYLIPIKNSNQAKRKWLENSLGMWFTASWNKLDSIINPDFIDFEGVENEIDDYVPSEFSKLRLLYDKLAQDIKKSYKKCSKDEPENPPLPPFDPITPIHDPSGYVYEGISSNRLEGVTATAFYKEIVEDIYGDLSEKIVKWDAEEYAQKNPLFTDENGMYSWDVPQGQWQVKFEKDGYQTTYSEWLPVPPPQMDVNIAMVQNALPEVKTAKAYEDGVEIEFSKYMKPETLTGDNIYLKLITGETEEFVKDGTIELLNGEAVSETDATVYASKVALRTERNLGLADEVYVIVSNKAQSYAGIQMAETYTQKLDVEKKIREIVIDETLNIGYEQTQDVIVGVLPVEASKGKTLRVKSASEMIATISGENIVTDENGLSAIKLDENGQATFTVNGELLGTTALALEVVDADITAQSVVNVVDPAKLTAVKDAVASRISGTTVYRGQTVALSCETEGATIYYTTDGSCPCDEATRVKYDGKPIAINSDMTLKIMAVGVNGSESDVKEYTYSIKQTSMQLALAEGWNWASHNQAADLSAESLKQDYVNRILTQTEEIYNDPNIGFTGYVGDIAANQTVKVETKQQAGISLSGEQYNPTATAITLRKGWNWVGYPLDQTMAVGEALSLMEAEEGDYVTNLAGGYAQYYDGAWTGSLETMAPGQGYLIKSASDKSFIYNDAIVSNAKSVYGHRLETAKAPWTVDVHRYPSMMCITADLYVDDIKADADEYFVGAFAGDECRGVGKYVGGTLFLSVYGNEPVPVTFVAADRESGETYRISETVDFTADVLGSLSAPYALHIGDPTGITSVSAGKYEGKGIYNMLGQKLDRINRSGVYIIDGKKVSVKQTKYGNEQIK